MLFVFLYPFIWREKTFTVYFVHYIPTLFTTLEKAACVVYERLTVCIFNFLMAIIQCIVMCDDAGSFVAVQRIQLLLVQLVQARARSIHLRIIQTRNLSQYVFIDLQGVH